MSDRLFKVGTIWYAWVYQSLPNGKRKQVKKTTGCTDKAAARLRLAELERQAQDPHTAAKQGAIFQDAFDLLFEERESRVREYDPNTKKKGLSEETVRFYKKCSRNWLLYAGRRIDRTKKDNSELTKDERETLIEKGKDLALADVEETFVDAFIIYRRANGAEEYTISKDRTTLRAALKLARRKRIWSGDIELCLPSGFSTNYEPRSDRFHTWDELQKVLKVLAPKRKALIAFIAATSAEWAAVVRARREDLDRHLARVRGSKNKNRDRVTPIVTARQKELLAITKKHADGTDGLLFSPWSNARRDLADACEKAGVPVISPHDLRRTYVRILKAEGLTHSDIAPGIGHGDTRMLDSNYGRETGEELVASWKRVIAAQKKPRLRVIEGGKKAASDRGRIKVG